MFDYKKLWRLRLNFEELLLSAEHYSLMAFLHSMETVVQSKTDGSSANLKKTVKNSATQRLLRYGGIKTGVPPKFTYFTVVKA